MAPLTPTIGLLERVFLTSIILLMRKGDVLLRANAISFSFTKRSRQEKDVKSKFQGFLQNINLVSAGGYIGKYHLNNKEKLWSCV